MAGVGYTRSRGVLAVRAAGFHSTVQLHVVLYGIGLLCSLLFCSILFYSGSCCRISMHAVLSSVVSCIIRCPIICFWYVVV